MKSNKKSIVYAVFSVLFIGLVGVFAYNLIKSDNKITTIHTTADYPISESIREMVDNSDLVVMGQFKNMDSKWNMARNPNNIQEPDSNLYVEGHMYNFKVEKTITGKLNNEEIKVNIKYSTERTYKDDDRSEFQAKTIDPLYIEPELNANYILFLNYDENFDNYYGSSEPFLILIEKNNIAKLISNTVNPIKSYNEQEIEINDKKKVVISSEVAQIKDNITGKTLEQIINEINN
ncbi:hypothetical protein RZN22_18780 [Bacillaceae bacterium S4-13-58]